MNEQKRTRKYHYKIQNGKENLTVKLMEMTCKYHCFGYSTNDDNSINIEGIIILTNPKPLHVIQKTIFGTNIAPFDGNKQEQQQVISQYKLMDEHWESGQFSIQGRKKKDEPKNVLATVVTQTYQDDFMRQQVSNELLEKATGLCDLLMKQNQTLLEEFKQLKAIPTTNNGNIQNVTNNIEKVENKTFNINLFLNEECKNAITLTDFIESIKIEDADLYYVKEMGMSNAITYVVNRQLEQYDINTRPVHCTDIKRETVHIKEEDGWIRESGPTAKTLQKAIQTILTKNVNKLKQFGMENPRIHDSKDPMYDEWLHMMISVVGIHDTESMKRKVLKNIINAVYLNNPI